MSSAISICRIGLTLRSSRRTPAVTDLSRRSWTASEQIPSSKSRLCLMLAMSTFSVFAIRVSLTPF